MNRRPIACVIVLVSLLVMVAGARAETRASIGAIHPADGTQLAIGASLHVRIEYQTDEPVRLWARPFLSGTEVKQAFSNASEQYSGSGQALGWFALTQAGSIDEICIVAGGGSPYRQWIVARQPVAISWSKDGAAATVEPEWAGELQQAANARSAERTEQQAREPVHPGDAALFSGFMLTVVALLLAGIALPVVSAWKWRGGWRVAATIPLALMAFVVLRIAIDTARDRTSHNLWPFEILIYGAVAAVIIGALRLARKILRVQ